MITVAPWGCTIPVMRWWPRKRKAEPDAAPQALVSISDPAAAALLTFGSPNFSGVTLSETGLLGLSGMYRALSLLSGTLGMLPLKTYQDDGAGDRQPSTSIFDNPGGDDGPTPFEWMRDLVLYHKIHGNCFSWKLRNAGGAVVALEHIHPLCVGVEKPSLEELRRARDGEPDVLPAGGKWFTMTREDGSQVRTDKTDIMHIRGLSLDGLRGLSLVQLASNSLGTAVAGDRAAARIFSQGAMIAGIVSPKEDADGFDAVGIRNEINQSVSGYENAGTIAVVNRVLDFTPWTMTMQDAQFLQSRQFSIEEISRWTGVPPHLLMQTEKQTSWGTGVEQQNTGMSRTVLGPDANLYEQTFSREVKPKSRFVEFDFAGLERPSPEKEIELVIAQWDADLLTLNEVRKIRNMPPIPGGDVVKTVWEASHAQPATP